MISHTERIQVRYQETDAMGITYHGNYMTWFEIARVRLLDQLNHPYRELETQGYLLPVLEIYAKYATPTQFDDIVEVTAIIKEIPKVKIRIEYELRCEGNLCVTGYSIHAFMDTNNRAIKPPLSFMQSIQDALGEQ